MFNDIKRLFKGKIGIGCNCFDSCFKTKNKDEDEDEDNKDDQIEL